MAENNGEPHHTHTHTHTFYFLPCLLSYTLPQCKLHRVRDSFGLFYSPFSFYCLEQYLVHGSCSKKCLLNGWVCFWSHSFVRFPSFPAFCMHSALKHVLTLQLSKRMFSEGTIGLLCCLLFLCTPPTPPQWLLLVLQRILPFLRLHFFFLSSPLLLVNSHGLSIWADSRWKWVSVAWWRAEDWVFASPECLYWQMAVSYWHLCPLVILQLAYLCWSNALIVLAFNSVNAGVRAEGKEKEQA